MGYLFCCILL